MIERFDRPLVLGKMLQDVVERLFSTLVLSEPQDRFSTTSTRAAAPLLPYLVGLFPTIPCNGGTSNAVGAQFLVICPQDEWRDAVVGRCHGLSLFRLVR